MIKVKKHSNGTYHFRVSLGFDPVTGKRVQKRMSGFKTKAEAENAYAKLILDHSEGAYNPNSSMTFEKFTKEFFVPWYKNQVKESTFENRQHTINKHFAYFYNVSLSDITPLLLQRWQLNATEKYSSQYVRGIQGLLSLAFDRAIVLGLMKENPSKIIGNVKKVKTEIDFWKKEEFEAVISHEDIQTTLGTYGHLYPNSNFQVADRLSNIIQLKTSHETQIEHYSSNQFMQTKFQSVPELCHKE